MAFELLEVSLRSLLAHEDASSKIAFSEGQLLCLSSQISPLSRPLQNNNNKIHYLLTTTTGAYYDQFSFSYNPYYMIGETYQPTEVTAENMNFCPKKMVTHKGALTLTGL